MFKFQQFFYYNEPINFTVLSYIFGGPSLEHHYNRTYIKRWTFLRTALQQDIYQTVDFKLYLFPTKKHLIADSKGQNFVLYASKTGEKWNELQTACNLEVSTQRKYSRNFGKIHVKRQI